MRNKMTRRQLTGAILATAAAAQTPPPAANGPEAELQAARDQNQRRREALAKAQVAMETEPAFHFST